MQHSDCHQQVRANTRWVLQEFLAERIPVRTLTKSPTSAYQDLDILKELDAEFGVSLVWMDDFKRAEWEPGADSVNERLKAMRQAHEYGIRTWASIEPVIEPSEALAAIQALSDAGVQNFKIGRLNHLDTPAPVDWVNFREMAKDLCKSLGRDFLIKKDLENITESRVLP
jgi:DNA repair photolyase